ncbi:MAG: Na+/H+ antiporter NhaC family protein [Deltaproteobacteria bacterium]|nr:MAG: Na+/H+ antiporter NhaC family protein [Deltaproteobacteria bacterium]
MWLALIAALSFQVQLGRDYRVGDLALTTDVTIAAVDADGRPVADYAGRVRVDGIAGVDEVAVDGGKATLRGATLTADEVVVRAPDGATGRAAVRRVPGFLSLLPPLVAIALAIWLRQALVALFAGIWLGALFVHGFDPLAATLRAFDTYLPQQVADTGNAQILLFTLALGGMVGIISKTGGSKALVDLVARRASSRRSGMLSAAIAGIVVFFDDYANCLLVGNTVRPFTDSRRISREKLSFLVDATAAPVSTIALVSTWTGYQLGQLDHAGVDLGAGAYDFFLQMIPYSFYSLLTIAFVFMIAASQRDFGPMLAAERRAIREGLLVRPGGQPLADAELTDMAPPDGARLYWQHAALPIGFVIVCVVVGLYAVGVDLLGPDAEDASLREIVSAAGDDAFKVLLWASFGGSVVALASGLATRSISLYQGVDAWVQGAKSMMMACFILVLAWGIGDICKTHMQTGDWLMSVVSPGAHWMPMIVFVVSGLISFATGSSFSTMAIVIPIAAPMVWGVTHPGDVERVATMAAVLSGAVFGDHCSPISDTTIMASMASAADHIDHVRTQLPYALLCAAVAAAVGYLPAGFGISPVVSLPAGVAILAGVLYLVGRRADA